MEGSTESRHQWGERTRLSGRLAWGMAEALEGPGVGEVALVALVATAVAEQRGRGDLVVA